jgi:hypothetical protein
MAKKT